MRDANFFRIFALQLSVLPPLSQLDKIEQVTANE
jgi:hypothetical protein